MKPNEARFESFPWEMEILELEALFDVIDDFLKDEKAKNAYLRKDIFRPDDGLGDPNKVLVTGIQVFRRQMVVLLKTHLEQIIKDFSINVFIGKPEKMGKYLLLNEFRDGKSLGEFEKILGESKTTSLSELPKNAAIKVMKGDLKDTLKKVAEISNAKIKASTKAALIKLDGFRNDIVHQASDQEINPEFLHESFEAVRDLIVSFREVCAENNISDVEETDEADDWE